MTSQVMASPRGRVQRGSMTTTTTPAGPSSTSTGPAGLRPFLLADAALTGGNGIVYLLAAAPLAAWFGIPPTLLLAAGAFLAAVGVGLLVLATRRPIPRLGVVAIAELNAVWAIASLVYAVFGGLTGIGVAWTLLQAALVAAFAARQWWYTRQG